MQNQETDLLRLAAQFVNSTASHIFLTGKAGTGKTTFLHNLAEKTHKSFVIVAPTGIAALNARGVTIHSQFLLPLGSFVPEKNPSGHYAQDTHIYTQHTLTRRHALNSLRKQILRNIDLLIIDEVSMLRADVLDAIDYRLRSVKRNFNQSFGGVQLLMIGDLFQLPPIVRNQEWSVLRNYYKSMHFFEAQALKSSGFVTVELNKIFRQEDDEFIGVLNNLRSNRATSQDIALLNKHYKENYDAEDTVTITTHNNKANEINLKELNEISGPTSYFVARLEGDFPENIFPVPERIELKEGAQIMFVKNDAQEGKYFNGKLARVKEIDESEESIKVIMADSHEEYVLKKESWENKKYSINESTKELEEDIVGTFEQFPIKLAWAITVHKSQGLTFDKAIIDVGRAFAPGQIYVALSRLRSLDGLILKTKINPNGVSSDANVIQFSEKLKKQAPLDQILDHVQIDYLIKMVAITFNFIELEEVLQSIISDGSNSEFEDEQMRNALPNILRNIEDLREYAGVFVKQLQRLVHQHEDQTLTQRLTKGSSYYTQVIERQLEIILLHQAHVAQFSRTKTYLKSLEEVDQLLMKKWNQIEKSSYITHCILEGLEIKKMDPKNSVRLNRRNELMSQATSEADTNPKNAKNKSGRKRKIAGPKKDKGETFKISYALIKEGMSINEVAISRELTTSTIESHAARGIREEELKITDVLSSDIIGELHPFKSALKDNSLSQVHNQLKGKYSYGILRMMKAHIETN